MSKNQVTEKSNVTLASRAGKKTSPVYVSVVSNEVSRVVVSVFLSAGFYQPVILPITHHSKQSAALDLSVYITSDHTGT